jgi:serine/threonine protein kinase
VEVLADDLFEGDVVAGRYRLDHLLGEGGMGSVWAATHLVTRKSLAVKFLLGPLTARPDMRERFLREARAASAVDHPNVVEIFDVFELDDGTPVMVMALLRGETLEARLRREAKLPFGVVAEIFLPVVSAVGTAHARGVVHRDLKPDNVFLAVEGEREVVKVLDFGIAKLVMQEERQTPSGKAVTAAGTMLGTLCYMSPEQAFGERDVDHRADIWAMGVMLYETLAGVLPVEGDHIGQVMKNLMTKAITPIESLVPELPADASGLIMRMLARERDDRPADLREVHEALSRYAKVAAPEFGPPDVAARLSDLPSPTSLAATSQRQASSARSVRLRSAGKTVDPGARTVVADSGSATGAHAISVVDSRKRNRTVVGLTLGAVAIAVVAWFAGRSTPPVTAATSSGASGRVSEPAAPARVEERATAPATTPSAVPSTALAEAPPALSSPVTSKENRPSRPKPAPAVSAVKRGTEAAPKPQPAAEGLHEDVPF